MPDLAGPWLWLKCLWNEILGCRFIVLHERPFDTRKNAIYLFSFQSYKDLNISNQWDTEKGLGTRIYDVIWLESQFYENLNYLFLI